MFVPLSASRCRLAYEFRIRTKPYRSVIRKFAAASHPGRKSRHILSLSPTNIPSVGQEIFDLSGRTRPFFRPDPSEKSQSLGFRSERLDGKHPACLRYPPGTRGVFHYYVDPSLPPISGELRFRLCDDLNRFEHGSDLEVEPGVPWGVPLFRLVWSQKHTPMLNLLLREKLVEEGLVEDIRKLRCHGNLYHHHCLFDIHQPHVVDLSHSMSWLNFMTRQMLSPTIALYNFSYFSTGNKLVTPFTGHARVRLELSTFPEHQKAGPSLVLRFLDIIKPVKCVIENYDDFMWTPQAGELLTFNSRSAGGPPRVWSYQLNKRKHGAMLKEFMGIS